MFLTPAELAELTGRKRPSLQRAWLVQNGYKFDVRADGRPSLLRAAVEARQGARSAPRTSGPNWDALR